MVGLNIMRAAAEAHFTRHVETLRRFQKVINEIAAILLSQSHAFYVSYL